MTNRKQILWGLGVVGAFIIVLAVVKGVKIAGAIAASKNFMPPPEAITTAIAKAESWQNEITAVGTLTAVQGVTLAAEESGRITAVPVESGAVVTAGAVLVEIDSSIEQADYKSALAELDRADRAARRESEMRANKISSAEALERALADLKKAQAMADALKARIDKKRIVAPFDGRVGVRLVNVGQYVTPGTPIMPLYDLDPMYVDFSVPQRALPEITVNAVVKISADAFPQRAFSGTVTAFDPVVSEQTRNGRVRAVIQNPDELLRPGMFVSVQVTLPSIANVISIPATSVSYAPYGDSVYVIEKGPAAAAKDGAPAAPQLTVRNQIVKLGERRGDFIAVLDGLKEGEEIASSGIFKLRPGAQVLINNSLVPKTEMNPTPPDT